METTNKISSEVQDGRRKLERTIDRASAGAHDVIEEASEAVRPAMERTVSGVQDASNKIADIASQAADSLASKGEQLKRLKGEVTEQARSYVRENPVASLGIALAAGYVISRLLSSR